MNYKILTLSETIEWNKLLNRLPLSAQDIYYTPEYYSLYQNLGDGKAMCFVFEKDNDIALYPFLLNSVNILGYKLDDEYYDIQGAYGYNGVVSSSYSQSFINDFYQAFESFCKKKNVVAEFVRFHPILDNHKFSQNYYDLIFDRNTVFIDTQLPENEIFSKFQTTTRKQIKRCTNRHNIEVAQKTHDISSLDDFLNIYWETMKRVKSINYLFFNREYFKDLLLNNDTIQYIAMFEEKPIASITALFGKHIMHGHLGGALTEYLSLSAYSLLYWEMIKTAKQRGLKLVHVGGGATNLNNDKLLEFKKNFSTQLTKFYIGKKIYNNDVYKTVQEQWLNKSPISYSLYKNRILGYREIDNDGR